MLKIIKFIHTIIWAIMAASTFIAFYSAFIGRFDGWFFIPAALLFIEAIIIIANKWKCPITELAEKYTEERHANFDIYLPERFARHNVRIFTWIIALEIAIVAIKWLA